MRTKTFRPYDQDSLLLMPPSLHDWVDPEGLPAFLNDLVDELDLAPFLAAHDEPRGMPPYHPRLMLKVLLYGYATGVRSSRRIEERLGADVNFMFLAGQARPDHKTIAEFRRRHLAAFEGLFLTALRLCQAAGLAKLGRVAIDGTKLKANASKHKAMSYGRMAEREVALAAEVAAILAEAEAVDAAEDARYGDARGDELPPELRRRETRLARIREAGLPAAELGRQLISSCVAVAGVLGRVDRLGLGEDRRHLGCEGDLALGHPAVAHRLVLARVRLELRAVDRDPPELRESGRLAQPEGGQEEALERREVTAPELGARLVVGTGLPGEKHEANVGGEALLELARARHPGRVAVEEDLEHEPRVVGRHPPRLVLKVLLYG